MASGEVLGFVPGIWDELAAGTPGSDASVGGMAHPDSIRRTAGYVTRMSGGVRGREPRGSPLSRLGVDRYPPMRVADALPILSD
jgi:hypothetical protein